MYHEKVSECAGKFAAGVLLGNGRGCSDIRNAED